MRKHATTACLACVRVVSDAETGIVVKTLVDQGLRDAEDVLDLADVVALFMEQDGYTIFEVE